MQRILRIVKNYKWQIVIILFLFAFTLGYIGFYKYTNATGRSSTPTDILYLTLQLSTIESGAVSGPVSWELEIARWLVPLVTAYTAVLAATALFRKQLQMVRLWYIRDHIIICGLGEKGLLLSEQLVENGQKVVIIEEDSGNPRNNQSRENGIVVIEGDATSPSVMRKVAVHRANHLVVVCGDDGVNAEVAMNARQLSTKRKDGALQCTIHIVNPHLCDLLREQEFGYEAFPTFRLEMFNIYERGAQALLNLHQPFEQHSNNVSFSPHILVLGVGQLGENLVVQIARSWYESWHQTYGTLKITIVDEDAQVKAAFLQNRFPKLSECCDLITYPVGPENPRFQQTDFLLDQSGNCDLSSIYICLRDQTKGLQSALQLRKCLAQNQPPIIVRMQEDSGLAKLLQANQHSNLASRNIVPFGLLQHTCTPDLVLGGTHEVLARAVHEDYLKRRLQEGFELGQRRSLVHWDELPTDLRESNRRQVDQIRLKLQAVGYGIKPLSDWEAASHQFSRSEIETMAQLEHDYWVQERQRKGWRFAPGHEDIANKTHPDILPWSQLSEDAKEKDRQPAIGLPKLLTRAGFQVYKMNEI